MLKEPIDLSDKAVELHWKCCPYSNHFVTSLSMIGIDLGILLLLGFLYSLSLSYCDLEQTLDLFQTYFISDKALDLIQALLIIICSSV